MSNYADKVTPATPCDTLLREAIRTYRELDTMYQSILRDMSDTPAASIEKSTDTINSLLRDAQAIDRLIAERLGSKPHLAESTRDLLSKRDDLLRLLHRSNRTLVNKAQNIQSLLHHEIVNMAKNRNALKGYKPVETERKSIVRNSF